MGTDYSALYCRHYSLLHPAGAGVGRHDSGPAATVHRAEQPAVVRFDDRPVVVGPAVEDLDEPGRPSLEGRVR